METVVAVTMLGIKLDSRMKHGLSKTPENQVWRDLRCRCNNPNHKSFYRYGGRGIKVCKRWDKFANFYEDMGRRPDSSYTIDRIDNNGDYSPANCRWATKAQQSRNTSVTSRPGTGVVKSRRQTKPWRVQISVGNKTIHIGCYISIEEAAEARKQAELKYWSA